MAADRQRLIPCPGLPGAWRPEVRPGQGGAAVWIVCLDAFVAGLPAPTGFDLADAGSRSGEARRAFLQRRAALRLILGVHFATDAVGISIRYDPRGAPRLCEPLAHEFISVSGRENWAAFALASGPIGIDLEPLEPAGEIPSAVLTPAERRRIDAEPEPRRGRSFLRVWTAKEAYLKALGTGLWRDPAQITIAFRGEAHFSVLEREDPVAGAGSSLVDTIKGQSVVAAWFLAGDASIGGADARASRTPGG